MNQAQQNRRRYTLLADRRRALNELHTLSKAVATHPQWQRHKRKYPNADGWLRQHLDNVSEGLCKQATQADNATLLRDVRFLYRALMRLSKVWVRLEQKAEIHPTMFEVPRSRP